MMPCIQLHPQRPVNESTIFIIAVRRDAMCKYACARVIFMPCFDQGLRLQDQGIHVVHHDKQSISRFTGVDTVLGGAFSRLHKAAELI